MVYNLYNIICSMGASQLVPVIKNLPASAGATGDRGLIPGSGRSPGEGNDNPLQYPYLENPMDRGDWWATVHGDAKSQTQLRRLSTAQKILESQNDRNGSN